MVSLTTNISIDDLQIKVQVNNVLVCDSTSLHKQPYQDKRSTAKQ